MVKSLKELAIGIEKVDLPSVDIIDLDLPSCLNSEIKNELIIGCNSNLLQAYTYIDTYTTFILEEKNLNDTKKNRKEVYNLAIKKALEETGINYDAEVNNSQAILDKIYKTPTCEQIEETKTRLESIDEERVNDLINELSFSNIIGKYKKPVNI